MRFSHSEGFSVAVINRGAYGDRKGCITEAVCIIGHSA